MSLNPILLAFIFLTSSCLYSCITEKNESLIEPKIAKTVPANYFDTKDTHFHIHQDTVFYDHSFFTGYRFELGEKADTISLQSYFNGVEEGTQKKWYPNGQLSEQRFYINGKKEGIQQGWWPNGKQKFYFKTYNNEYTGEFREWLETGLLIKCFHYENGYEVGSQRLWWNDGTVRANYVIKNGKKYGLLGYKICENPYDSILAK